MMPPSEPTYGLIKALHPDVQPRSLTLTDDHDTIGRAPLCQIVVARSLVYSAIIGSNAFTQGRAMALGPDGGVTIAGTTSGGLPVVSPAQAGYARAMATCLWPG